MTEVQAKRNPTPRKDSPVKGHDAVLRAIQNDGRDLTVRLIDGDRFHGKIVGRDKYTVTIKDSEDGFRHVIFKHAISYFFAAEDAGK